MLFKNAMCCLSLCRCICITLGKALIPKGSVRAAGAFLAGACAGSVSKEGCLAEGVLQGNDPPLSEEHSQKLAGLGCFLGCSLRPRR